ncbi:YopX family protein [Streptococcus pneumoniae]|nr:YopX family protein [Streptococcus pneumoniae]
MIPKFRAWDKARNEMNYRVMVGNCDTDDENWTCPIIWIEERQNWLHFDDYDSIMQSTGLKDKNGQEIFEGDIVKCNGLLGTIESFKAMWICSFVKYNNYQKVGFFAQEIEVVGNIYENPELLEDKE